MAMVNQMSPAPMVYELHLHSRGLLNEKGAERRPRALP